MNSPGSAVEPEFQVVDKATDQRPALSLQPIVGLLDEVRLGKRCQNFGEPLPFCIDVAATDKRLDEAGVVGKLAADAVRAARTPIEWLA
ncbi:MAG: hypothetical protein O2820_16765 [Planctomycetota bacterium]|nr:hypothetical protein [Planctomycetota bacterium]